MKKTLTLSAALLALLSAGSFALADDDDRPHFARGEDEACSASDRDGGFRFWSRECESEHGDVWFMGLRPRSHTHSQAPHF